MQCSCYGINDKFLKQEYQPYFWAVMLEELQKFWDQDIKRLLSRI